MNYLTPSKVAAYLALIFIAGGATGAVLTYQNTHAHSTQPASIEKVCSGIQNRLKAKLSLTDEQMKKLQPVFERTGQELQAVGCRAIHETDQIICRAHQEIAKELTPQQRIKLEEFDRERRDWIRHRLQGPKAKDFPSPPRGENHE